MPRLLSQAERYQALAVENAAELGGFFGNWLQDEKARDYAGGCAFGYIERHLGAADRTAALLADLFPIPLPKAGT